VILHNLQELVQRALLQTRLEDVMVVLKDIEHYLDVYVEQETRPRLSRSQPKNDTPHRRRAGDKRE